MKFLGLINLIVFSLLSTILIINGVTGFRLRRALFDPVMNNPASTTNLGQSSFPWFGPSLSQQSFPFPNFPSAEQIRRQVQSYISAVTQHIKDQQVQSSVNCTPSETKTEIINVNGRRYNRTVTTCVTSGSGSAASAISSSTIPLDN